MVSYFVSNSLGHAMISRFHLKGSIQVIVTGVAPSRAVLGTVNGIAQAVACVMRSLAPSIASSLFAISLQRGWAGGDAVYYILLAITACGVWLSFTLPKALI